MSRYYVNKNAQTDGYHEVHTTGCPHPPNPENRIPLGNHESCGSAMIEARKIYPNSDGCKYCCPRCNRR